MVVVSNYEFDEFRLTCGCELLRVAESCWLYNSREEENRVRKSVCDDVTVQAPEERPCAGEAAALLGALAFTPPQERRKPRCQDWHAHMNQIYS